MTADLVLSASAAGFRRALPIMRKIALVLIGATRITAVLAAFASCLRGAFTVIGEVARAVLPAHLTCA